MNKYFEVLRVHYLNKIRVSISIVSGNLIVEIISVWFYFYSLDFVLLCVFLTHNQINNDKYHSIKLLITIYRIITILQWKKK